MPARSPLLAAGVVSVLAALVSVGLSACWYDPVPQDIIDSLGEETGTPGPTHRPGQPCLACHGAYEGVTPFAVGGTVYKQDDMGALVAAPRVIVTITDTSGDSRKVCTNAAGNFYIEKSDWDDIAFPLAVTAGDREMRSLIGRDGSCATCHKTPAAGTAGVGAAFDTPGVVIVSAEAVDDSCPGGS
ncbi:MAG: hypothetical protein HUU21_31675 [Polyangiaceae bacterium]|nr:hypothetical protein [Polyangiaceae bacterium]